jgi:hypothetical protein
MQIISKEFRYREKTRVTWLSQIRRKHKVLYDFMLS